MDNPTKLETERLLLRPYSLGDREWLQQMFQENEIHLAEAIEGIRAGMGFIVTEREGAEQYVRHLTADRAAHRRVIFGIWEKTTGHYVGELWIECRDWQAGIREVGYFLVQAQQGRGLATEACRAGIDFIFSRLQGQKIVLTCADDNARSARVAERCGFAYEGYQPDNITKLDGTQAQLRCYGLSRAEYERRSSDAQNKRPSTVKMG